MNIAIVGIGKRGAGIAQAMALGGHMVAIYDLNERILQAARTAINKNLDKRLADGNISQEDADRAKKAIIPTLVLEQCADADFIIEAAPEKPDVKTRLFEKMDRFAPRTTVLASTTGSMSLTPLAAVANRFPERVIGMHFFPPIATTKLVEVVPADQTSESIVERTLYLLRQLGRQVIQVKDTPGRIVDRLMTVYSGEALRLLGEGQVTAETVDKLMATMEIEQGPFRWLDSVGIDTHFEMTQKLYAAFFQELRFRPHPIQQKMVDSNRFGRKTKQGFYKYNE